LVGAIALGTALILLALVWGLQQAIDHERASAMAETADLNSKIVLSDEVRVRSLLASLDKVILVLRKDFNAGARLTHQQLLERLDTLKVDTELSVRVTFVDAAGDIVLTSSPLGGADPAPRNVADRAYFQLQKILQDDVLEVAAPMQSRLTGEWMVPLTRRITNPDGSFGGVVLMAVDPALFSEPFAQTSVGANATRAIVGLDGYTRLRINDGKLAFGGDSRTSQLFNEIQRAKVGCYTAVAASDGVRRSVCYRVIEPFGIAILAGTAVESLEAMVSAKSRIYSAAAALFAVMTLLLSSQMIAGILRQRKLLLSQHSFNALIELVPQLVFRLDARGHILWANSRALEFIRPSQEARAPGFAWVLAAVHADDRQRVREHTGAALQGQLHAEPCEVRVRRFDGEYLWFACQITLIPGVDGNAHSYLQTGTDIHDRKMAEERTRVAQKLESIGQLTGGMAHDFNNLLAIIVGNLDLLAPQVTQAEDARRLHVAKGAAERGVGLVKSLLALASKQPLLPVTMDLAALVERITPLLRHALGQRVRFEVQAPASPVHVEVDEAGLEAVLLNLCVNARDAMPQGGDLILTVSGSGGMAHLVLRDTGTGMPEAVLKRATEPFFTTKERGHGTGLGLSMVAGFVKQSGGTMKIQSVLGQGTTISLDLPMVAELALAPAAVATAPDRAMAAPSPANQGPCRILVVDDETELAVLVRAWAKEMGHTAVLAHSAQDALTLLAVRTFDIMLTDIMMPGQMDGIALAETASALYPAMNTVLMSGYSRETATARVDLPWRLLVKPFGKADFAQAVGELANHAR
jgi:PAS domain S-box-containing protein